MEFKYEWSWELEASAEALWPRVSDTNRFNRDTGIPAVEDWSTPDEMPKNGRRKLRFRRAGLTVEWEETPFEWVRPFRFGVVRRYTRGPLAEMRVRATLTPLGEHRTRLDYQVHATPSGILGLVAIPLQIGLVSARTFGRIFRRYAAEATDAAGPMPARRPTERRFRSLSVDLQAAGVGEDLADSLIWLVQASDPLTLSRLRPYGLADLWRQPREAVLRAFLIATRLGIFSLQWDLLCPLCRGSKDRVESLKALRGMERHCDTCLVDFSVDLAQSVELSFRLVPRWGATSDVEFCVAGPQITPHIVAQLHLEAGQDVRIEPALDHGRYRVRALGTPGGRTFQLLSNGDASRTFKLGTGGWEGDVDPVAQGAVFELHNATDSEKLIVLERTEWADDVVTAAEVTSLGTFRDLFSSEVLDHGEFHSVQSLTVLFTDLLASTHLYYEIGDAPAFSRVIAHFEVLRTAVEEQGGTVVKTIGDAVMATFTEPQKALLAIESANQALARTPEVHGLTLKAGVNTGPCILVTLNDRLDYFGSTVNIAARLASLSAGGDVVFPQDLAADSSVAAWLDGKVSESFEGTLRGFDEPLRLARVPL